MKNLKLKALWVAGLLSFLTIPVSAADGNSNRPKALTISRIFDSPDLNGKITQGVAFSPDGKRVTFLQAKEEDRDVNDLWEYNIAAGRKQRLVDSKTITGGKETLSEEEKARKERQRISQTGITEYYWDHKGKALIFPLNSDIYLYDIESKKTKRLTQTAAAEIDIQFSPEDNYVSFVREQNLYVIQLSSGEEFAITKSGKGAISYGTAEFMAQEEMDRNTGYWWADDEKHLAYTRIDETPVQIVKRYEIGADKVDVLEQRYPAAGTANVKVELYAASVPNSPNQSRDERKIPLVGGDDIYLPRVEWLPDSQRLSYQIQSRDQKNLDLYFYDLKNKSSRKIISEKNPHWVNLHNSLKFLKKADQFIWLSEKSGFAHLYLYNGSGEVVRPLTAGNWEVDELLEVDEEQGSVYFSSGYKTPLEHHLLITSLKSREEPRQITPVGGWHSVKIDKTAKFFTDRFSNEQTPPQQSLHKITGERLAFIEENKVDAKHPLKPYAESLIAPEYKSFKLPDGTELFYSVIKPVTSKPASGYPTVLWIYGGPTGQTVRRSWGGSGHLWQQTLAQEGYLVVSVDNRGTPGRGRKFSDVIYKKLGEVESSDFASTIRVLEKDGLTDPRRVLIAGWSYGGYMALLTMAHQAKVFTAGVAVAPVTDWSLYDTHYTERYLGTPQNNASGYAASNVLTHVDKIKGKLMVIHGMADDNVLFTHTTLLMKQLQEKGILFQTMVYPGAKHGIYGKANKTHVYSTMSEFIRTSLESK